MRRLPWWLLVAALAVVGGPGLPEAEARRRPLTLRMPSFVVPPRSNREVCVFVPVPASETMEIGEVAILNSGGNPRFATHHMILYRYAGDLDALPARGKVIDDTACLNFGGTELQIVATSQAIRSRQIMPAGTALPLAPTALKGRTAIGFVLNSHWINASDKPQRARVKLKLMPARNVRKPLRPIFEVVGNGPLKVAPGETRKTGALWAPGLPSFGQALGGADNPRGPACVTMLIGHMHRRGTLFTATLQRPGQAPEELYRNTSYADPPALEFDPPLLVKPGESITYECTHDNATDPRLGCEEAPGATPGRSVIDLVLAESPPSFETVDFSRGAAKLCTTAGPNPAECPATDARYPGRTFTGNCVPANLVFGFTSEDEMCILPGYFYDADPEADPGHECDL